MVSDKGGDMNMLTHMFEVDRDHGVSVFFGLYLHRYPHWDECWVCEVEGSQGCRVCEETTVVFSIHVRLPSLSIKVWK